MNSPMFGGVAPSHLVTPFHALLIAETEVLEVKSVLLVTGPNKTITGWTGSVSMISTTPLREAYWAAT